MADSNSKGMSTGVVVAIGVGAFALGVIGTAAVYEMAVIPDALEKAGVKPDSSKTAAGSSTTSK